MIFVPVIFAFFLWCIGYVMTVYDKSNTAGLSEDLAKIIAPPKWLYYLCGAPVSKEYPKGVMRVAAFQSQMAGIFLGVYLIWYVISRPSTSINVLGLGLCLLASYLLTAYVSRRFTEKKQAGIRWRYYSKNRIETRKGKK